MTLFYLQQRQLELEDQYTCESYLLNTTHRPEQYRLLLERLKKAVARNDESCESLDEAILLIDRKISEINTALAIESIRFHPGNLKQMGPFIMKEKFFIKRKYNSIVYLFQGGVVFCVEDQVIIRLIYIFFILIKWDVSSAIQINANTWNASKWISYY